MEGEDGGEGEDGWGRWRGRGWRETETTVSRGEGRCACACVRACVRMRVPGHDHVTFRHFRYGTLLVQRTVPLIKDGHSAFPQVPFNEQT